VIDKVAQPLAQGKHPQIPALTCPVEQRVELCAQRLADRGGDGSELPRELIDRMAEAVAEMHPWKERPHALGRAIEAVGEDPSDPV
jgi:hypothetical protein